MKTCVSCGRRIEWRKKWARSWDDVRYCSAACRRRKVTVIDRELEDRIRFLLAKHRDPVDLHEVARAVGGPEAWQDLEEPARRAARRVVASGDGEIVQRGRVVDASTARGEIHIRRSR